MTTTQNIALSPSNPLSNLSVLGSLLTGASVSAFAPNSRYYGVETTRMQAEDGTMIAYLRRRFIPPPEQFALLQEHIVTQGERLDNITATYLGDPELFWRLCDANGAMRPEELTETIGQHLRITLPQGMPAIPNAGI